MRTGKLIPRTFAHFAARMRDWPVVDNEVLDTPGRRPDRTPAAAIEAARAGDQRGFAALFGAFGAPIAGYLRGRGVSDPEGLANEVFVRAFRTLETFRGDVDGFRSWLFTIAHHAAVDDRRRAARRPVEVPTDDGASELAGGDVEVDVLARLAQERVGALLDLLSPDQRDVVLLRIVGDLSVAETAEVLGRTYEGVKALQRRALARLRRALASGEGVPR
jgi:RNA polymerase sigma-70 factor (ECF subfamily)